MWTTLLAALIACQKPDDSDPPDTIVDTPTDDPVFDDDIGVVCAPTPVAIASPPRPSRSFPFLPTSNGWIAAQYAIDARGVPVTYGDGSSGSVDQTHAFVSFADHLTKNPTATTSSRDLLWDAYPGVRVDGTGTWLGGSAAVALDEAGYVPGTGIVRTVQRVGDVRVEFVAFAPFQAGGERDLVVVLTATNTGSTARTVDLRWLANAHTGGEGRADNEGVSARGNAILESRGDDHVLHLPIGGATSRAAAPGGDSRNPWQRLAAGQALSDELVAGNDVAAGFQWDLGSLPAGAVATRGAVLSWGTDADALVDRVSAFVGARSAEQVLAAEIADWDAWHAVETRPSGLSPDEEAVFAQSTAVLRMAQVREPGSGHGQILASLPPGIWNIAWPRDGAYATVGLVHSGHYPEAAAFLRFIAESDSGEYASWLGLDDYMVSVARYRGDGTEESDGAWCPSGADAGPNIELDDFGLFLWAFGEYARANPGDPWIDEVLPRVLAGVADPLVQLIDPNTGLLVPDSSIWERHWNDCFPNGRKRFAYSAIQAVVGLRVAAELSGDPTYTEAAETLRTGLLGLREDGGPVVFRDVGAVSCPVLASSPEETCDGCGPFDGSVIDIVAQDVIRADSSLAIGTLGALQAALVMESGSPGFKRTDDGTGSINPYPWYDDQEWVMVDLRMATAFAKVGRATGDPVYTANSRVLVDWITAQAVANSGLIPELLSDGRYTGGDDDVDRFRPGVDIGAEFQGAVPMGGFGPGAYILALEAIHAP